MIEGILDIVLFVKMRPMQGSSWVLLDGIVTPAAGADDLHAMAVEFGLGDRHPGGREHDLQRSGAGDDVVGGAQGNENDISIVIVVGGLVNGNVVSRNV